MFIYLVYCGQKELVEMNLIYKLKIMDQLFCKHCHEDVHTVLVLELLLCAALRKVNLVHFIFIILVHWLVEVLWITKPNL